MPIIFKEKIGFEWTTQNGNNILLKYEFAEPEFKIKPSDNIVFEIWANDHAEAQIYPITFDGGSTCGWLFTVSALNSQDITLDEKDNKFFRIAAWAVVRYLVEKYRSKIESIAENNNRYEFNISDLIDDELSIFALHRLTSPQNIQNDSSILILKFLEMGLIPYIGEFSKTVLKPKFNVTSKVINISTKIPEHEFRKFYSDLLTRYIPSVIDNAFKFYLYYQIIESMMEDVLVDSAKFILADLTKAQGNAVDIRDSLERYQKATSESSRIKQIFSLLLEKDSANLRESCISFLSLVDSKFKRVDHEFEGVGFFIYKVRNQLIHNFRRTDVGNNYLNQIIGDLEDLIPSLIWKFGLSRIA